MKKPPPEAEGNPTVLLPAKLRMTMQLTKTLAASYSSAKYGIQAMEDEIISTFTELMNFRPSSWKKTLEMQLMRQLESLSSNSKAKGCYLNRNMLAGYGIG